MTCLHPWQLAHCRRHHATIATGVLCWSRGCQTPLVAPALQPPSTLTSVSPQVPYRAFAIHEDSVVPPGSADQGPRSEEISMERCIYNL